MLKLEIYRKRPIPSGCVVDDVPETVFENIAWLECCNGVFYGNIEGEELAVGMDEVNYKYIIR